MRYGTGYRDAARWYGVSILFSSWLLVSTRKQRQGSLRPTGACGKKVAPSGHSVLPLFVFLAVGTMVLEALVKGCGYIALVTEVGLFLFSKPVGLESKCLRNYLAPK